MEYLKVFSDHYANAVTALAAIGALTLAGTTLWYLKREYFSKYRPYVFPSVHVEPFAGKLGCSISIIPRNVGYYPCRAKLINIRLTIGDETHTTPDAKVWLLLAPSHVQVQYPVGYINEIGITKIREGRFRSNRVEVAFELETTSMEGKFSEKFSCAYEIEVLGETPQALFRPEWIKNV